jgi:hypothetical protein
MVKNNDVVEEFVKGSHDFGSKNLFIEGNVIYSYSHQFIVAIRLTDEDGNYKYIINIDKYSQTTSRHQSAVLRAIGGDANVIKKCNTQECDFYKKFTTVREILAEHLE